MAVTISIGHDHTAVAPASPAGAGWRAELSARVKRAEETGAFNVAKITIGFAVLLIILGIAGFVATGSIHYTALIPTWAGIVFLLLGVMAMKDNLRKHAMHFAAMLAVIGFAATAKGIVGVGRYLSGGDVARPAAAVTQAIMALLCLGFVALCVRSFVATRRARSQVAG
jgi:hypothetical protein